MVVTWVTFNQTATPTVEYGTNILEESETGFSSQFIDGGNETRLLYIHRVVLDDLVPGLSYSMKLLQLCRINWNNTG